MRINRLWQKLALSFVAVAVAVTLVAFFLVNLAFDQRFQSYIQERREITKQRIIQTLELVYARDGGWSRETAIMLPHWAVMSGVKLKIVAQTGQVVASTPSNLTDAVTGLQAFQEKGAETSQLAIVVNQVKVGTAYITPIGGQNGIPSEDLSFRQSINTLLLFGGLAAIAASFLISYILSIRLSSPLEVITAAARKMEAGDLTQRVEVKSKDEIGDLADAFNHLSAALGRQESLRQNLTADIAHELRTPLTTIQSHIEAYLDGVMEPNQKNIKSIHEEILRLTRLVGDLGEIAQVESGKANIVKSKADLNKLTDKVVTNLAPLFEEKNVALKLKTAIKPLNVKVDADKICQVLYNLLYNALKFTPEGGLALVSLATIGKEASITIKDSGIGIAAEHLPSIFERFFRVEKSRNRETGGAGIGLTVVKELVAAHDGRITVSSEPGKGTEFKIILPLAA